jgi:hypothetical protein
MKTTVFFILVLVLFHSHLTLSQTSVWIRLNTENGQSAYIADNYLTTSFPNHPDLISISWTSEFEAASARTLFQFYLDSIPRNAQILDARLSLYANPYPNNPGHFGDNASYLRRVTSNWNANVITWEPQPDYTHQHEVLLQQLGPFQNHLNINVTELIKDMINNPRLGFGFILMQRFEYPRRSMNFASGVCPDTSKRPLLTITYAVTAVTNLSNAVPPEFKIFQNYPNPFNPVTRIRFDIPATSFVNLRIFDALGRQVEELISHKLAAGEYSVEWVGSNYTSGVYYYSIQFGNTIQTRQMILLK